MLEFATLLQKKEKNREALLDWKHRKPYGGMFLQI